MGRGCLDGKRLAGPYGSAPKGQPGSPKAGLVQPRATPWVAGGFPCAPRRGKSHGRCASVTAFAPFGGVSAALLPTRGDASFGRSTPGWELATPSGFCLERWSSKNRAGRELATPFGGAPMGRGDSMGSAWPGRMAAPRRGNRARRRRACSQPRATPWVAGGFQARPEGAKAMEGALLSTRGDASFGRSTPGWEPATPSGFSLNAGLPVGQGGAGGARYVSSFLSCPRFGSRARRR